MSTREKVLETATWAHSAAPEAARLTMGQKETILNQVADKIWDSKSFLQNENARDVEKARSKGLSLPMIDRLTLSDKVLKQTVEGLKEIASFPDPVGEITRMWVRPNGMRVGKMRIPLGVVGMIYESRPNVTADAAALCLKAGNACILRGGSEAFDSNVAIAEIFRKVLKNNGVNPNVVNLLPTTEREAILHLVKLEDLVDLIIPRGGEELIRFVSENSRVPVVKHYKGVCHMYVDKDADFEMAEKLVVNAKAQRPGVCNALETLLVHAAVAEEFLPRAAKALEDSGVALRGCDRSRKLMDGMIPATEDDWYAEYSALILAVRIVDSMDEAIRHIAKYGSSHTEAIVTKDYSASQKFLREVNSSTVIVNASTRMSDGYVFGLGAEIGISTTKIHAYGPMGVEDLTTTKYIVLGEGQIRE